MDQLPHWISAVPLLPAIFVGTFFFGETVVLAGVVLAAAGRLPVTTLLALALLGTLASDIVWFYCGQRLVRQARRFPRLQQRYDQAMEAVQQAEGRRPRFHYLLFFKFVYGIRIVTIVYTSLRRISLRRFLVLDALGSAAYLLVFVGVGLLLFHGAKEMAPAFDTLRYVIAAPVLSLILMRMGTQWLRKRLFDA